MTTEDAEMSDNETNPPQTIPIPPHATFVQLANLATAHGDSPKVWVDALIQLFYEAQANPQLVLEAMQKTREQLRGVSLVELSKTNVGRLLRIVAALDAPQELRASLLWTFASRTPLNAPALTLAHVLMGPLVSFQHARFLRSLALEFDPSLGKLEGRELSTYFEHVGDTLFALRRFEEAAVHAKCALATCTARAPLAELGAKVFAYELVAGRCSTSRLPSFLSEALSLDPLSPAARQVAAAFEGVTRVASPRDSFEGGVGAAIDAFCRSSNLLEVADPLKNAFQVAWLEALHAVMPRIPLAVAEHSGPTPPLELLESGAYNATFDGQVFILRRASQWAQLERCLAVVQRLPETRRIAAVPRAAADFYEDDIVF